MCGIFCFVSKEEISDDVINSSLDILKNRGYNNTNIRLIKRLKLDNILRVNLKNDKLFKVFIK